MHIDKDGWLVEDAEGFPGLSRVPSIRTSPLFGTLQYPLGVVWHWTGGPARGPAFARALAEEIRNYDRTKDRPASWHVLVAKDGRLFQSVQLTKGAWHVGKPGRIGGAPVMTTGKWDASAWAGQMFPNVNNATVGVELENSGQLEKVGDKFYCWPFWLDPDRPESGPDAKYEIPADRAVAHDGQWFDAFPLAQEMAATRLLMALMLRFKWTRDVSRYGHLMFDSPRKADPGPVWLDVVLPRVLDRVFGGQ